MINTLINDKWENAMPKIDSNYVDLIITSPPYNVKLGENKFKKDKYENYKDDLPHKDYLQWMKNLFTECNRVLKHGGRMCVNIGDSANGTIPLHSDFIQSALTFHNDIELNKDYEPFVMMTTIIWYKNQTASRTAWGSYMSPSAPSFPTPFEYILIFGKGTNYHEGDKSKISVSRENFIRNSWPVWEFNPQSDMMKKYGHPAMFPMELPRRLIDQLSYEEDIVFDPFSGVGTTACVAKSMNRNYIGIEMSKKYHEKAQIRVDNTPNMIKSDDGNYIMDWI